MNQALMDVAAIQRDILSGGSLASEQVRRMESALTSKPESPPSWTTRPAGAWTTRPIGWPCVMPWSGG